MKNKNNLYFISILAEAFEQEDRATALKEALHEIIQLGNFPEYRKGFEQFLYFMASGQHQLSDDGDSNSIKNPILKKLQNSEMDQLIKELLEQEDMRSCLELELYRDEKLLATQSKPSKKNKAFFKKITPGNYTIKFSNGRVLWQGVVVPKNVIWKHAFPKTAYKMAAATEKDELDNTESIQLLDGELLLTFHAGLETGRISIDLSKE
jgi:hypothetical protein